jgi:hypothetical protein
MNAYVFSSRIDLAIAMSAACMNNSIWLKRCDIGENWHWPLVRHLRTGDTDATRVAGSAANMPPRELSYETLADKRIKVANADILIRLVLAITFGALHLTRHKLSHGSGERKWQLLSAH